MFLLSALKPLYVTAGAALTFAALMIGVTTRAAIAAKKAEVWSFFMFKPFCFDLL
jgi:hypothetical protein